MRAHPCAVLVSSLRVLLCTARLCGPSRAGATQTARGPVSCPHRAGETTGRGFRSPSLPCVPADEWGATPRQFKACPGSTNDHRTRCRNSRFRGARKASTTTHSLNTLQSTSVAEITAPHTFSCPTYTLAPYLQGPPNREAANECARTGSTKSESCLDGVDVPLTGFARVSENIAWVTKGLTGERHGPAMGPQCKCGTGPPGAPIGHESCVPPPESNQQQRAPAACCSTTDRPQARALNRGPGGGSALDR